MKIFRLLLVSSILSAAISFETFAKVADESSEQIIQKHNLFKEKAKALKQSAQGFKPFVFKGVRLNGAKLLSNAELEHITSKYYGKLLSRSDVISMEQEIEKEYIDNGYLLSFLEVPAQSYDNGILQMNVVEGKIRSIQLLTNVENPALFEAHINKVINMYPVTKSGLERALMLIGKIPGHEVDYQIVPVNNYNKQTQEVADILVYVKTRKFSGDLNVNNHGSKDFGKYQVNFSGQVFNPTKSGDSLILRLGTSNKPNKFKMGAVGYLKRLNTNGTSASILYSKMQDSSPKFIDSNDEKSDVLRLQLSHYLYIAENSSLRLDGGYNKLRSEHFSADGKSKTHDYTVNNMFVSARYKLKDSLDGNSTSVISHFRTLGSARVGTPMNGSNGYYDFDKKYHFTKIDVSREQLLPQNFSLMKQASYLEASKWMPVEQQFIIGGDSIARGYKGGLLSTKRALSLALELRYTKAFDGNKLLEFAQPYIFADYVAAARSGTWASKSFLTSAGFGSRFFFAKDFYMVAEYGIPMQRKFKIDNKEVHNKNQKRISIGKSFEF